MTDDLVKRLRNSAVHSYLGRSVIEEAADRIEDLTAQLKASNEIGKALEEDAGQLRADNARLREVVLEADKLLCGDLAGLQWKRECRSFLVWARAVLKGESHN